MAGFDDLVRDSQPRYMNAPAGGVPGVSWEWRFTDVNDFNGDPIVFTGTTAVCKVVDNLGGVLFEGFTVTFGTGEFTVSATATATAGAAVDGKRASAFWFLSLTNASRVVQMWGPEGSPFQFEWTGA